MKNTLTLTLLAVLLLVLYSQFSELAYNFVVEWAHSTTKLSANSQHSRENIVNLIDQFRGID